MQSSRLWAPLLVMALALETQVEAKLSKGDPAPPFELTSMSGSAVSSQTLAQGGLAKHKIP